MDHYLPSDIPLSLETLAQLESQAPSVLAEASQASQQLAAALQIRDQQLLPLHNELQSMHETLEQKIRAARQIASDVVANMRDRFRADNASLLVIDECALGEFTGAALVTHLQKMSSVWAKLPVPADAPIGSMAYVPWQGMNRAAFDQMREDLAATLQQSANLQTRFLQAVEAFQKAMLPVVARDFPRQGHAAGIQSSPQLERLEPFRSLTEQERERSLLPLDVAGAS